MTIPNLSHLISQALKGKIEAYELLIRYNEEKKLTSADYRLIEREISHILPDDSRYSDALTIRGVVNEFGECGVIDINFSINLFEQAILLKNSIAMYCRATFFYQDVGSPIDHRRAIELFEQSAALNNPKAIFQLGQIYQNGKANKSVNINLAIEFYEKAIPLNSSEAMVARAELFRRGIGTPINIDAAVDLYQRAATLNNKTALLNLARMNRRGIHGLQNFTRASEYYSKAVALNCTISMMELGTMFETGQGMIANLSKAIDLYYKAYCLQPRMNPKCLIEACIKSVAEKSKQILFTFYLDKENVEKISELFNSYPNYLIHLLYKRIIALLDLEINNELRQSLINLFLKSDSQSLIHISGLIYLEFKLELQANNRENALKTYSTYLAQRNDLSANDFYRLGNLELENNIDLSPERRIIRITNACYFYYKAYKKGDERCYSLLIRFLNDIQKIKGEENLFPDEQLFNRFVDLIPIEQNDTQKKHITAFETYVLIEKNKYKKKTCWSLFFNPSPDASLNLAEKILNQLHHNIPLTSIIEENADFSSLDKQSDVYLLAQSLINETTVNESNNERDSLLQTNDNRTEENSIFEMIYSLMNTCMESRTVGTRYI